MANVGLTLIDSVVGHEDHTWSVSWSRDGNLVASCGADKAIRVWNRRSGDQKWVCRQTVESAHERTIRRLGWSSDDKFLAAASFDSTASVYEMTDNHGTAIKSLTLPPLLILILSFALSCAHLAWQCWS